MLRVVQGGKDNGQPLDLERAMDLLRRQADSKAEAAGLLNPEQFVLLYTSHLQARNLDILADLEACTLMIAVLDELEEFLKDRPADGWKPLDVDEVMDGAYTRANLVVNTALRHLNKPVAEQEGEDLDEGILLDLRDKMSLKEVETAIRSYLPKSTGQGAQR